MREALRFCAVIALAASLQNPASGQDNPGRFPAKIELSHDSLLPGPGEKIKIHVTLLDADNRAAPANKNFDVEVQGKSPNGDIETAKIEIKAGETDAVAELPITQVGLLEITGSNKELATGGAIINIRNGGSHHLPEATPQATAAEIPQASPGVESSPVYSLSAETTTTTHHFHRSMARNPASTMAEAAPPLPPPSAPVILPASGMPAASPPQWVPKLKLDYYPKRPLKADTKDSATICALLPPTDPARDDMQVYLWTDIGPPAPVPIKIPKGEVLGTATLTADRAATVHIGYTYSSPWAADAAAPITVSFCPPVWGLKLFPKSSRIGLFEACEIGVQLVDSHGISVPADEKRSVHLAISEGSGDIGDGAVAFDSGNSYVSATFVPIWPGAVTIVATSAYLQNVSTVITVSTPIALLVLCAIGGLVGGLLAYWTNKDEASWQRIVIGLITGFVLYWALLFGVVKVSSLPHPYLLNPFSAAILALLGGWGGTKLITFLLKKMGLDW